MRTHIIVILLIGFMLFLPLIAQNDYLIIVNKSAQYESLSRANIESIFLGKKSRWSDGIKIIPVNLKQGHTHELFIKEMIRKSTTAYMNYWRKMIFTGKGVMPVAFQDEVEVAEYIFAHLYAEEPKLYIISEIGRISLEEAEPPSLTAKTIVPLSLNWTISPVPV